MGDPSTWMEDRSVKNVSRRLCELGRIVRLVLERDEDGLTIVIKTTAEGVGATELRFRGAVNLRFRGETTELKEQVMLLAEDVSADGWEDVKWRVWDSEEEVVSFFCRDVDGLS